MHALESCTNFKKTCYYKMSSPSHIHMSDSDDERRDSPTVAPLSYPEDEVLPHATEEETEEEDPSEDDPSEEEPMEDEQEESHSALPTARSERIPLFTPYRIHSSGPRTICTPRKSVRMPQAFSFSLPAHDPYLPSSSSTLPRRSDARKWIWIRATLARWRRKEGNPFSMVGESSVQAQACPITGEPPHHTIPLLIARIVRHETEIESLQDNIEAMPNPEDFEEMQRDVGYIARGYRDVRSSIERLNAKVGGNPDRLSMIEHRLDCIEHSLEQLHVMADTMRDYASFILKGDHLPKKDH